MNPTTNATATTNVNTTDGSWYHGRLCSTGGRIGVAGGTDVGRGGGIGFVKRGGNGPGRGGTGGVDARGGELTGAAAAGPPLAGGRGRVGGCADTAVGPGAGRIGAGRIPTGPAVGVGRVTAGRVGGIPGRDIGGTGRGIPDTGRCNRPPATPGPPPTASTPSTTTVSGCSKVVGATPKEVWIKCAANGIRLDPPTKKIPTRSLGCNRAPVIARSRHATVLSRYGRIRVSNSSRVI